MLGAGIMDGEGSLFTLAESGPYANQGCEAIVRGRAKILREHSRDPRSSSPVSIQSKEQFQRQCLDKATTGIIPWITKTTEVPVYLILHMINPDSNDHEFMQRVLSLIKDRNGNRTLIPPNHNVTETKQIISRMAFFAGARIHSTVTTFSARRGLKHSIEVN